MDAVNVALRAYGEQWLSSWSQKLSATSTFLLDTQLGLVVSVFLSLWAVVFVAAMIYADSDGVKEYLSSIRRYVPYDAGGRGDKVVCVDCTHNAYPTLTHHKDSTTPGKFKGDTSTDTVFNALLAGWPQLRRAKSVTCNHFDIDGICSVWSLMHPAKALRHERILREAAMIGDMRAMYVDPSRGCVEPGSITQQALRLCCWLNTRERELFSRPFEGNEEQESANKYAYFLPLFGEVLDALEACPSPPPPSTRDGPSENDETETETSRMVMRHRVGWTECNKGEAERLEVERDVLSLWRGFGGMTSGVRERVLDQTKVEWDELGVMVIRAPHPPHYYALFSLAKGTDAVVSVYPGNRYEVEYRYTGFVELQSRPTWPRFNLAHLAKVLNSREKGKSAEGKANDDDAVAAAESSNPSRGAIRERSGDDGEVGGGGGDENGDDIAPVPPTPPGARWDAPGVTDSGPLLRLNDPNNRLSKAERYGNPRDRPIYASTIRPDEFLAVVKSFFEFGTRGAKTASGVNGEVPRRGWTWRDTHAINAHVKWDEWVASETRGSSPPS